MRGGRQRERGKRKGGRRRDGGGEERDCGKDKKNNELINFILHRWATAMTPSLCVCVCACVCDRNVLFNVVSHGQNFVSFEYEFPENLFTFECQYKIDGFCP